MFPCQSQNAGPSLEEFEGLGLIRREVFSTTPVNDYSLSNLGRDVIPDHVCHGRVFDEKFPEEVLKTARVGLQKKSTERLR